MFIETRLTDELVQKYTSSGLWGEKTIGDYLAETIARCPEKTAVVDSRGKRLTYQQLGDVANRLAFGFLHYGVRKGDIVSVQLPNCVEFVCIYFALEKIGAIFNPLNATYRHSEVQKIAGYCESKIIVVQDVFRRFNYVDMVKEIKPDLPDLQHVFVLGETVPEEMVSFAQFSQTDWAKEVPAEMLAQNKPGANDILTIIFTSGTEAQPKGVMLTHNNLIAAEKSYIEALEIDGDDVCFMPSPFTHATGFAHGINMPMMLGEKSVSLDIWNPEAAIRIIAQEKCTYSMGATPFLRTLLDSPDLARYDTSSLTLFMCGGAPVPKDLMLEGEKMGLKVLPLYGLTESFPHACGRRSASLEDVYGTDGRPCANIEVSIRDNGVELPIGEVGEECSRGPNVCMGYFKRPDLNAKCFDADGWFYSGDLAKIDEKGNLVIEGRLKDIIIRGGQNISTKEIEDLLLAHPKIYNVVIVAMPDRKMGEKACAFIIPRDGQSVSLEDVTSFLKEKKLAMFKLPERVEVIDEFPMTPSGKVQRFVLRDQLAKQLEVAPA
ncbi:cyclohexanecarboxylate-CoA ligase [Desulfosarcina ovata subsp. sediminis]|uniref:Cyclohexanecarboxylate-CoA ligase n=1 Tax=Desulfosarcina ovata subsp. sediminis TaxID=885957 RepID=A0A5K7ZVI7_9BACT|nr:AMP-binding protein [Desulfosarcina ovata]BBO84184.1 cyclohexanecarboxylate-CoA ligase [Desulfosarcina ovata subsp. sediminis]